MKSIEYTIIKIGNRADFYVKKNVELLKDFRRITDIEFVDGREIDASSILLEKGINIDAWNPYDGRRFPPMPSEFGIWATTVNIFEYAIKNSINDLLVLEDDIELEDDFVEKLNLCLEELPTNYDYLSLFSLPEQNQVTEESDINKKYIHKSINQPASACATLYSLSGALKILQAMRAMGMEYTSDCFVHNLSKLGIVDGYSIKTSEISLMHLPKEHIPSIIDPQGRRSNADGLPHSSI